MKNTYTHSTPTLPTQTLEVFDVSPFTERLQMMVALTLTLLDIEWADFYSPKTKRLQRRCMTRVKHLTSRVRRTAKAIVKIKTHNALLGMKLDMLRTPEWRARVLKDLGGMHKLKLWDAAWLRHMGRLAGDVPVKPAMPVKPEPVWWRSPERVAESERLKARFRFCDKACVNPRTFKDPFKMDFEGEFRLAPISRATYAKGLPRIYSKVDICEYGYDAMPIWKDFGLGVAVVYPMEFYAAMILEAEDISHNTTSKMFPCVVDFAKQIPRDSGSLTEDGNTVDPGSADAVLDREHSLDVPANDNHALIEFIGRKNYKYIFENPG